MKITFFLGAGFSAPFGHPVMNKFFGFADAYPKLHVNDRSFLGQLILEARRANSFLESSPTNLEDILSFAEMGERLLLDKESGEGRNYRLRTIIQKVYTNIPKPGEYWSRYERFRNLIAFDEFNNPPELRKTYSFITTNYDLNIESAFIKLDNDTYPGFDPTREYPDKEPNGPSVMKHLYSKSGIPLYKLHGSVNWFDFQKNQGLYVDDRIVPLMDPIEGMSPEGLPYVCIGDYQAPDAPVIIPPSFLKPDLHESLKAVWAGAAKALSTTNVLAFVGYSFPPSDTEMMYFLARALMDNTNLRVIYVVDPLAEEIVKRLKAVGSKLGSHFRDLLDPVQGYWKDVSFSLSGNHLYPYVNADQ